MTVRSLTVFLLFVVLFVMMASGCAPKTSVPFTPSTPIPSIVPNNVVGGVLVFHSDIDTRTTLKNTNEFLVVVKSVRQARGKEIHRMDVVHAGEKQEITYLGLEADYWVYDSKMFLRGTTVDD